MRFLANARNDSVICDIGESRGDSHNESPLLSPYTTNKAMSFRAPARNRVSFRRDELTEGNLPDLF